MNSLSKATRTRNFIIEKTAEIFNKKGYAGTSMSDLTSATGLTKGSIYGNFENKENVALAAFDYNLSRITQMMDEHIQRAETFHEKLMAYAEVYRKIGRSTTDHGGCPILNTAVEADDTNNPLKSKAAEALSKWEQRLEGMIRSGMAAGEFREDTNVRQTALSMIALIEGGVMMSKVTADATCMDYILKTLDLFIQQIK